MTFVLHGIDTYRAALLTAAFHTHASELRLRVFINWRHLSISRLIAVCFLALYFAPRARDCGAITSGNVRVTVCVSIIKSVNYSTRRFTGGKNVVFDSPCGIRLFFNTNGRLLTR